MGHSHEHDHGHGKQPCSGHDHSHNHQQGSQNSHNGSAEKIATTTASKEIKAATSTLANCSHNHHHGSEEEELADVKQRRDVLRRLKFAVILCGIFMAVEVVGGLIAGSLAVLSDAAHLMADMASFAVAIVANYLASMPSTAYHTYGLKRTESLAALFSMASLAVICVVLSIEAVRRLYNILYTDTAVEDLYEVDGRLMSLIAGIGVLVNIALAVVLGEHHVHLPGSSHSHDHDHGHSCSSSSGNHAHHQHTEQKAEKHKNGCSHDHDHSHDHGHGHEHGAAEEGLAASEKDRLIVGAEKSYVAHADEVPSPDTAAERQRNVNLHAAYLHVLGDLAQSVAVLIAGIVIWFKPNWAAIDPIITLAFCLMVFYSTLGVIRRSVAVLMEEVPPHVNWKKVHDDLEELANVTHVHDLHIWAISDGIPCMSVHASAADDDCVRALRDINDVCIKHGLLHVTAQVQPASIDECITCAATSKLCASRHDS